MEGLIHLILVIVLFAAAGYGGYWVCEKFKMPLPVYWLVGAIFLIVLLYFLLGQAGVNLNWPKR